MGSLVSLHSHSTNVKLDEVFECKQRVHVIEHKVLKMKEGQVGKWTSPQRSRIIGLYTSMLAATQSVKHMPNSSNLADASSWKAATWQAERAN